MPKVLPPSTKPSAIRKRMRRRADKIEEDVRLLTEAQRKRYKPIEDWTLEELAAGRPKNEHGRFDGPRPRWITPLVRQEVERRLKDETLVHFKRQAATAVRVLADFLTDDENPQLRFKAAQLILEYVVGKPDQNVTIEGNIQLHSMLASALVLPSGEDAHPVIDGQFVDEEDDDDDEEL